MVGVGPRGFHSAYIKVLVTGRMLDADAEGAYAVFEALGQSYLTATMPAWLCCAGVWVAVASPR